MAAGVPRAPHPRPVGPGARPHVGRPAAHPDRDGVAIGATLPGGDLARDGRPAGRRRARRAGASGRLGWQHGCGQHPGHSLLRLAGALHARRRGPGRGPGTGRGVAGQGRPGGLPVHALLRDRLRAGATLAGGGQPGRAAAGEDRRRAAVVVARAAANA